MKIRETTASDLDDILSVEREAFNNEKEPGLVRDLLDDPSAKPTLSLLAFEDDKAIGHILFTKARIIDAQDGVSSAILAPLAIIPEMQKQGIGGKLIESGLQLLSKAGIDLVFVLGHPKYYPRYGFKTAGCLGFEAPYPIPDKHADAWMVQALRPDIIDSICGKVICAEAMNKPEYWRE